MFFQKNQPVDGRPTIAEWPIRVRTEDELKDEFRPQVKQWLRGKFEDCRFIYAPKRAAAQDSFAYLFGYGADRLLYLRQAEDGVERTELRWEQIQDIDYERNLLDTELIVHYLEDDDLKILRFSYVASVYYLYDPFLNWMLGLPQDFLPQQAERKCPRPEKLFQESLPAYNFSLDAYRLGGGFTEYAYHKEQYRRKWMPWKVNEKEWLEVPMERGMFKLYRDGYYRKCQYCGLSRQYDPVSLL